MAVKKTLTLTPEQRKLVEDNMGIVLFVLRREYGSKYADDEDNVSEGMYALCRAAAGYDPANGCKFSVYAYTAIVNWMRHLARTSNAPTRKPDAPLVYLDAPVRTRDAERLDKTVGDCIPDKAKSPEDVVCALSDANTFREFLDVIQKEDKLLVEMIGGRSKEYLQHISAFENITKHAMRSRLKSRHDRVRRKYAKEYRRIMGYDTDDRRRA